MTTLKLPLPPNCKPNLQYTESGNKHQIRSRYFLRGEIYIRNIQLKSGEVQPGWHDLPAPERYMKYAQERVNFALERLRTREAEREALKHLQEDDDMPRWDCAG